MLGAAFSGAGADEDSAFAAAGLKFSMSFLMILPPSALPDTCERSIPFSFAIFLANGEAFTRSFEVAGTASSLDSDFDSTAFSATGASDFLSAAGLPVHLQPKEFR